jgi:hypothetical protein
MATVRPPVRAVRPDSRDCVVPRMVEHGAACRWWDAWGSGRMEGWLVGREVGRPGGWENGRMGGRETCREAGGRKRFAKQNRGERSCCDDTTSRGSILFFDSAGELAAAPLRRSRGYHGQESEGRSPRQQSKRVVGRRSVVGRRLEFTVLHTSVATITFDVMK